MFRVIRKADLILLAAIVAAAVLCALRFRPKEAGSGAVVSVTVDGSEYGRWPLAEDRTVEIKNGEQVNVLRIEDGAAFIESADCKNQLCVASAPVSRIGQRIVCLPNRVVAEIRGAEGNADGAYDFLAGES